jgi:cytochrome c peroxidase
MEACRKATIVIAKRLLIVVPVSLIVLWACGSHRHAGVGERPIGHVIAIDAPLGLPPVPVPANNPETAESVALGRRLFYERKLSANGSLSCASCHNPGKAFTDGQRHSVGFGGKNGTRNAPTVINAAYAPTQFWDGRAPSLEEQAGGPIANPIEMNLSHELCEAQLEGDGNYKAAFEKAFGPGPITIGKVKNALASFERTLVSGNSPFDRYQYGGDKNALSPAAVRGLALFLDKEKGNCAACHTVDKNYALFTDGKFHNIGMSVNEEGELTDLGRYNETKIERDKGAFKTPTLRNVAKSAPYMHDGSLKTLKDVVDFYAGGGNSNPYLDKEIKPLKLSGQERADLVAFLESLTGEMPPHAGPPESAQTVNSK